MFSNLTDALVCEPLPIFWRYRDDSFHFWTAFVKDFGFEFFGGGFGGFAVGVGHGFGVAENHAGGSAEDFADGPGAVVVGEKDFAVALLFGAIVPTAE
jgi:hypothetical protein